MCSVQASLVAPAARGSFTDITIELLDFVEPVTAKGNIEDWLGDLVRMMQKTMKDKASQTAQECQNPNLRTFVDNVCAQMALLGIQFMWTSDCQTAIDTINAHYGYPGFQNVTGPVSYSFQHAGCTTYCFSDFSGYFCGYYNTDTTSSAGVDTSDDQYIFCTC